MTSRRQFLATGATLVATGAVLGEGLSGCAENPVQAAKAAPDPGVPTDDNQAFLEVSALLTGLDELLTGDRFFNDTMSKEYARKLRGTFYDDFSALLLAYKRLVSSDPPPKLDDALLKKLRATPEFKKNNEMLAKQIVNVWYFSQFNDSTGSVIDGGFYERGYVWSVIKAPPIGFSTKRPGYWAVEPSKEAL